MRATAGFIGDSIGSALLSYHIIAIYHWFVHDYYQFDFVVSRSLELLFQRNGAVSPLPSLLQFLTFLFVSSSWMSATINWDR